MKKALVLGCSHAAGSEMHLEPGVDLGNHSLQSYDLANSFATLIAEKLGYVADNHAIPGGSNDAMFRIFENQTRISKPDLVIAVWTGFNRTEIYDEGNQVWQSLAPGKQRFHRVRSNPRIPEGENLPTPVTNESELLDYQKSWVMYHTNEASGILNKIKNVLALNALAQSMGIPVINLDSFQSVQDFAWPDMVYRPLSNREEFMNWAISQDFAKTEMGHFFKDAHECYANLVVSHVISCYNN